MQNPFITNSTIETKSLNTSSNSQLFSKKRIKFYIQFLVIAAICYYFGKNIVANWSAIQDFNWRIQIPYIVLTLLFGIVGFSLFPLGVRESLVLLSIKINYKTSFKLYFYSQMAKYLPGRFWILLGRVYLYDKEGIDKTNGSIGLLFEIMLQINGSLIVFFLSYLLFGDSQFPLKFLFFLGYLILSFTFLHPRIFGLVNDKLLNRFTKKVISDYSFGKMLKLQLLFIVYWLVIGFSFYLFIQGVVKTDMANVGYFIGILPGAWAVGFLSFLTPAGLGVREGFMALLLKPYFPTSVAMSIAILGRLWWTFFDLVFVALATQQKGQRDSSP